jgi:threonine dehydratase
MELLGKLHLSPTPLELNSRLSEIYNCNIWLKREDRQPTKSFKIRGVINRLNNLLEIDAKKGLVSSGTGNFCQAMAYGCNKLNVHVDLYVPEYMSEYKRRMIKYHGKEFCTIHIKGINMYQSIMIARDTGTYEDKLFIDPYNDQMIIDGHGSMYHEIVSQFVDQRSKDTCGYKTEPFTLDYLICPIGNGSLMSGLIIKNTKNDDYKNDDDRNKPHYNVKNIIGVEYISSSRKCIKACNIAHLKYDGFMSDMTERITDTKSFDIIRENEPTFIEVCDGQICIAMIDMFTHDGIISEPSGAFSVACLEKISDKTEQKNIVCIIAGGNQDIATYPDIIFRRDMYLNMKHYFLVQFRQIPGQLAKFTNNVLRQDADIMRFEYVKKLNSENGPVLIGIELMPGIDLFTIQERMFDNEFEYTKINSDDLIYGLLI